MEKEKGRYTLDAILHQPEIWKSVIELMSEKKVEVLPLFKDTDAVIFTGCGSNYYMSLASAHHFQYLTGVPSRGVPASEIVHYPDSIFQGLRNVLVVTLCRSGETTEVVRAVDYAGRVGLNTLYIGCYPDSTVAGICDYKIWIREAQEKSVVTTKSYTAMFLAVQLLAGSLCSKINLPAERYHKELLDLPEYGKAFIEQIHGTMMNFPFNNFSHFVFLGSGPFYGIACESMLKMKEMALVPSDAFHSLEFRHGPKSILSRNVLVVQFLSDIAKAYEIDLLKEIKDLGGTTLLLCENTDSYPEMNTDYLLETGSRVNDYARNVLYLPAIQLLAFYKALSKGIDVDTPKNLSHFVRLE
jgi:glucosamine--fructose-6-phosphate aminotransferase (isomerizing)